MENEYRPELKAHVSVDDEGKVRQVLHSEEHWQPNEQDPRRAAVDYVRSQARLLDVSESSLDRLDERVGYTEPREEGESYRLLDEKRQFDSATFAFAQTYLNVPVWRTGITVTVKGDPGKIVESTNTTLADVRAEMPTAEAVGRGRELCEVGERRARDLDAVPGQTSADRVVRDALGLTGERTRDPDVARVAPDPERLRVNQGRFFIYRYDPEQRLPKSRPAGEGQQVDIERDDV